MTHIDIHIIIDGSHCLVGIMKVAWEVILTDFIKNNNNNNKNSAKTNKQTNKETNKQQKQQQQQKKQQQILY